VPTAGGTDRCRYVRSFETNGWFKFNDSLVTAVVEDDLFAKVGLYARPPMRGLFARSVAEAVLVSIAPAPQIAVVDVSPFHCKMQCYEPYVECPGRLDGRCACFRRRRRRRLRHHRGPR
jgi:hypothetical protein